MWPPKIQQHISKPQSLQSTRVFTRILVAADDFFSDLHCVVVVVVFLYIIIMCQVLVGGGAGGGTRVGGWGV